MIRSQIQRLVAAALTLFVAASMAQAAPKDLGPAVGATIPHDLSSVDASGTRQTFNTIKGEKGAVVVFFRSADWCPFCQRQLITLEKIAKDVKAQGYELVAISYDEPKTLAKFAKRRKISYTLLSDKGSKIIDAFNIRNEAYKAGHMANGVPHPVVFVINPEGKIEDKFYRESYRDRPENEVILNAISAE